MIRLLNPDTFSKISASVSVDISAHSLTLLFVMVDWFDLELILLGWFKSGV